MSRRQLLKLAGGALAGGVLAACAPAATEAPTTAPPTAAPATVLPTAAGPRFAGQKLTVANAGDIFRKSIEALLPAFSDQTGATVELSDVNPLMPKVTTDLSTGTGIYDVIIGEAFPLRSLMMGGLVQPLDSFVANDSSIDLGDFIPQLLESYGTVNGQLYGLPYKPDVYMFFYRKDLFGDAAVQAAFKAATGHDLKVPDNTDELIETARFFTKRLNPDSPIEHGFVHWGTPNGAHWVWASRLAAFGGSYLDDQFHPNFNNDAGRRAMEVALALTETSNPEMGGYNFGEVVTEFLLGKAAMMEQWPGFSAMAETAEGFWGQSEVVGKTGYAVLPGAVSGGEVVKSSILGGWTVAMSPYAKNQELAYEFMKFITSKEAEPQRISSGIDPCRRSTYARSDIASANPTYPVLAESLERAQINAQVVAPPVSEELGEILGVTMNKVWIGEMDGQAALEHVEAEWTTVLQREGLYV